MVEVRKIRTLVLALAAGLPLSACGSLPDTGIGATLSTLSPFKPNPADAKLPTLDQALAGEKVSDVECPELQIVEGQASFRTYASAEKSNANVRHQYSFGDLARECRVKDNKIEITVGVSGYVLSGPKGTPGSFQVPVRISVRHDTDDKIIATKAYRLSTSIAQGEAQAPFMVVTDPLPVPLTRQEASQDYTILIGFDSTPDKAAPAAAGNKRSR